MSANGAKISAVPVRARHAAVDDAGAQGLIEEACPVAEVRGVAREIELLDSLVGVR
jgi:hypothetical protein